MLSAAPGRKDSSMDVSPFVRGLALGLAVAAPVGPMSLLCMRRTLAGGFPAGFLSGLGVATADAIYGAVAAFGLVAVTGLLVGLGPWPRLVGAAVLLYLGVSTLRARPALSHLPSSVVSYRRGRAWLVAPRTPPPDDAPVHVSCRAPPLLARQ